MQGKIRHIMIAGVVVPLEAVPEVAQEVALPENKKSFPPQRVIGKLMEIYFHVFIRAKHEQFSLTGDFSANCMEIIPLIKIIPVKVSFGPGDNPPLRLGCIQPIR